MQHPRGARGRQCSDDNDARDNGGARCYSSARRRREQRSGIKGAIRCGFLRKAVITNDHKPTSCTLHPFTYCTQTDSDTLPITQTSQRSNNQLHALKTPKFLHQRISNWLLKQRPTDGLIIVNKQGSVVSLSSHKHTNSIQGFVFNL